MMKLFWDQQELGFPNRWRRGVVYFLYTRIGAWTIAIGYIEPSLFGKFDWQLRLGGQIVRHGRCATLEEARGALLTALGIEDDEKSAMLASKPSMGESP